MKVVARLSVVTLVAVVACLLLPSLAAAGTSKTAAFDQALDRLYANGYPQALEDFITAQGNNPDLGYRWAGTPAERTVADRVLAEFRADRLAGVRRERVPCDVFTFKAGSLTAGGETYLASAAGGPPPTGPDGITADLVYVGDGSAAAFDAAEAETGSVAGKLVLVDVNLGLSFYVNILGAEAAYRGAAGVICTDASGYLYADDAIGTLFESYEYTWPPMVLIAKQNGDVLRSQVQAAMGEDESFPATMVADTDVTLDKDGGHSYNVIGVLPGRSHAHPLVISAHMDANAWTGLDDAAALVNMLSIAKAMHKIDYRPAHDIIFFATTGEEFGHTDTWFDYLAGSWYAATHTHKDWAYRVRAFIGLELMGLKDAPLAAYGASEEMVTVLNRIAARNPDLVPYGSSFTGPVNSWNDSWPFAAQGVPGLCLSTSNDEFWSRYHTNYETKALVDWDYLPLIGKFVFRTERALDSRRLLPYDLGARADAIAATVDEDELVQAGADVATVNRLVRDIRRFTVAADRFTATRGAITNVAATNRQLIAIASALTDKLTALDAWGMTCYPHQQVLWDTEYINTAIAELKKTPVDSDAATAPLWNVSQMVYGLTYDYPAFVDDQARWAPGYPRLFWGGQGQLAPQLDLVAEYDLITAGHYGVALGHLTKVRDAELVRLDRRLARMASLLEAVTPAVNALAY